MLKPKKSVFGFWSRGEWVDLLQDSRELRRERTETDRSIARHKANNPQLYTTPLKTRGV